MIISQSASVPFRLAHPCRLTFRSVARHFTTKPREREHEDEQPNTDVDESSRTKTGLSVNSKNNAYVPGESLFRTITAILNDGDNGQTTCSNPNISYPSPRKLPSLKPAIPLYGDPRRYKINSPARISQTRRDGPSSPHRAGPWGRKSDREPLKSTPSDPLSMDKTVAADQSPTKPVRKPFQFSGAPLSKHTADNSTNESRSRNTSITDDVSFISTIANIYDSKLAKVPKNQNRNSLNAPEYPERSEQAEVPFKRVKFKPTNSASMDSYGGAFESVTRYPVEPVISKFRFISDGTLPKGTTDTTTSSPFPVTIVSQSRGLPFYVQPIPVLITGGSGDLARAIAHAFASHTSFPFHITLVGRKADRLKPVCASLPKLAHPDWTHSILEGDVSRLDFWRSEDLMWSDTPQDGTLCPAILINCAGVVNRSLMSRLSPELLQETIDVNLMSAIWGCRIFGTSRLMKIRRKMLLNGGASEAGFTPSIINVGSLLSTHGGAGASVYAASKAGLLGLTRALAAEYGRQGMRVNAILPGFFESQMADQGNMSSYCTHRFLANLSTRHAEGSDRIHTIRKNVPLGRLGTPKEVADAVVFLALNNYANNCVLNIDGGLSAVSPT